MTADQNEIQRFTLKERMIHWVVAIAFVYLMLTGLAFFTPHLYWLAYVLGGGTTIARWHPIAGLIFVGALAWMFHMWKRDMKRDTQNREWMRNIGRYIRNEEGAFPEVGRFNPGQKVLFWLQIVGGILLLLSGVPLWFPHSFPQWLRLISILVHEVSALAVIGALIVHIYMGTAFVSGSLSAMINGTVSRGWAKSHHPRWYRERISEYESPLLGQSTESRREAD